MAMHDDKETRRHFDGRAEELRWLWIRVGIRLAIGLLVVAATLWLILEAG